MIDCFIFDLSNQKTKNMNNEIATTIIDQLGGKRFIFMTGVRNLINTGNGVIMQLPRNASGAKYFKVTLNAWDLYDVEFYSVRGVDIKVKRELSGVYADQLDSIFENTTGLFTKFSKF